MCLSMKQNYLIFEKVILKIKISRFKIKVMRFAKKIGVDEILYP